MKTHALNCKVLTSLFLSMLLMSFNACAVSDSDPARLPIWTESSPSWGPKEAKITLVEFTDFECPFCASVQPTLTEILKRYPNDVRLVFKNFPLPMHRNARRAHSAALCAEEQGKFWEYRNLLFQNQRAFQEKDLTGYAEELDLKTETFQNCLKEKKYASKIEIDIEEGIGLGVMGTPAFLINGRPLSGAQPLSAFEKIIQEELAANKSN